MGIISDHLEAIARRAEDLSPIVPAVSQVLREGNTATVLAGQTPTGQAVAPLRPSTLRHRPGGGPPRAPHGADSRIVSLYTVSATVGPGYAQFDGGWPGFEEVIDRIERGSHTTPPRPIRGFRPADLDRAAEIRDRYLFEGQV